MNEKIIDVKTFQFQNIIIFLKEFSIFLRTFS